MLNLAKDIEINSVSVEQSQMLRLEKIKNKPPSLRELNFSFSLWEWRHDMFCSARPWQTFNIGYSYSAHVMQLRLWTYVSGSYAGNVFDKKDQHPESQSSIGKSSLLKLTHEFTMSTFSSTGSKMKKSAEVGVTLWRNNLYLLE